MHSDKPIGPLTASESDASVNSGRQDETVVVIGVLADKVHAARRANHDFRLGPVNCVKPLFDHCVSHRRSRLKAVRRRQIMPQFKHMVQTRRALE
jgi:hypothetical protein